MKAEQNKTTEQKYRREQLLRSGLFPNSDAATAVLRDDREYTIDEAVKVVQRFMGKAINERPARK